MQATPSTEPQVTPSTEPHAVQKSGFTIKEFCASIGISIAKFYILHDDLKPRTVKLHGRVIVIESPAAYLSRMAELQGG
jgi:hypothetical protein